MKIVTWNCSGSLRSKFDVIIDLGADIYVIQECENPNECKNNNYKKWAQNHLWVGDNKSKGLGVFAKVEIKLNKLVWSNKYNGEEVKYFLPCSVNSTFDLLAVWNHLNNSPTFGYIGQLWKYLQINKLNVNKTIILGDFNSNKIWDKQDRWWNHSNVVNELHELNIESLYHTFTSEDQGKESQPTFYLQRNINKPYHIDYIFANKEFTSKLKMFEIGMLEKWLRLSDHLPIVLDFDL